MHIICERASLWTAFQAAASVLPSRSPKPILQNIRLEVNGPVGTMAATDQEVGIQLEVEGIQCLVPGVIILPADRMGAILRETSEPTIELKSDGNTVEVRAGRSRFHLPVHDPAEYPTLQIFQFDTGCYSVSGPLFREMAKKTLYATSQDSNRYDLGGVLLEIRDDHLLAVSTDGRRLAKFEGPCDKIGAPQLPHTMTIVPTKSMNLIQRVLGDAEQLQFLLADNQIVVRGGGTLFFSRLLEGRFPKWELVIPRDRGGHGVEVNVGPLLSSIRQAAIVADQESRGIDFDFREGQLILSASTADRGNCRVPVAIPYQGPPIDLRLDFRFLEDFLKVLDLDSTFVLSVKDEESAALCTTATGYAYVLMPLSRAPAAETVGAGAATD